MKNPSRALLGLLLLGGLVSATAAGVAIGWSQRRVMAAVERSRHNPTAVAELVAANGRLGALPAFRSLGRARDAGELLNRHLALDDGTPAAEAVWWTDGELRDRIKEVWLKDPGSLSAEGGGPAGSTATTPLCEFGNGCNNNPTTFHHKHQPHVHIRTPTYLRLSLHRAHSHTITTRHR